MATAAALHPIIGKRPWKVWKGVGSFLIFEFGAKKKNPISGTVHGAYCLWIYMAAWRIKKDGKELAHSESSDEVIAKAAAALEGKRLNSVVLSCVVTKGELHYLARFHFEGGHIVYALMYDDHEPSSIFMLHTPSAIFSYDYNGALTKSKRKPNERLHRMAAPRRKRAIRNPRRGQPSVS